VLQNAWLQRFARVKHTSLVGPLISYKENELLRILNQMLYLQHLLISISYKWTQDAIVLHYNWLPRLVRDKPLSILDPFVSYEENELCSAHSALFSL
jgi:hypothetical protein